MAQLSFHSPIGDLTLSEEEGFLVAVDWGWGRDQAPTPVLRLAVAQAHRYFDGQQRCFDLPMRPAGTAYRQRVWAAACLIPFGTTWTYARLAATVGGSARAVGAAMAANPLPLLVPCHRVVAASGVGGYSGGDGTATKQALLDLERTAVEQELVAQPMIKPPLTKDKPT